jgi:protein TonB
MKTHAPRHGIVLLRWTAATITAIAIHGSIAWLALEWRVSEAAAGASEPAVMIELAAVSVAPEAQAVTEKPAPERVEPEPTPEPVKEMQPEPPPPDPMPEATTEPAPEVQPQPTQELDLKLPDLPTITDTLAVTLPKPEPEKPRPVEKPIAKPIDRKPVAKPKIVERKPVERTKLERREAAAPPPSSRASAPQATSQGVSETPSVSTASWRGTLIAHLNRYKRFPGGANPGTVQVAFSIDRGGRVISARLAGSSGDAALDDEAVAMIRRASPVPAPPDGVGGPVVALAVPVRFNR